MKLWKLGAAGVGAATAAAAVARGLSGWHGSLRTQLAALESARLSASGRYDPAEIADLPEPVRRYLATVLVPGQTLIEAVSIEQHGSFNPSERGSAWKPFSARQRVVIRRPGFVWDARIRLLPGISVLVEDAYIAGTGRLRAALSGLVKLADLQDTPELATAELMRFLAEAPLYPTALLPSHGIAWEAVDRTSAAATLTDAGLRATLLFRFGSDGLVEAVHADARGRSVGGLWIPTPWEGRWERYALHGGMLVPQCGEVAWLLPDGRKPYWRGRMRRIAHEPQR